MNHLNRSHGSKDTEVRKSVQRGKRKTDPREEKKQQGPMLGHGVPHAREPALRLAGSLVGRKLLLACWAAATALG